MPNFKSRSKKLRMGLLSLGAIVTASFSAGGAMGWIADGANDSIKEFKRSTVGGRASASGLGTTAPELTASPAMMAITMPSQGASATPEQWFPRNNTIQWLTTITPGQPLSNLSITSGDENLNLIATLSARNVAGGWSPVATMTITGGREALIRPPAGDYAMSFVAVPKTMPYNQISGLPSSPTVSFQAPAVPMSSIPVVRYEVAKGRIHRIAGPRISPVHATPQVQSAPQQTLANTYRPAQTYSQSSATTDEPSYAEYVERALSSSGG